MYIDRATRCPAIERVGVLCSPVNCRDDDRGAHSSSVSEIRAESAPDRVSEGLCGSRPHRRLEERSRGQEKIATHCAQLPDKQEATNAASRTWEMF